MSEPRRNKGGNPYIPKGDGDSAVQAYIAALPDDKRPVGEAIDAMVTRLVPDVNKAVRWNTPFYGVDGKGWFLAMYCYARYVQLTFLTGTDLDPMPPKASKTPRTRYLELHEGDEPDERVADWIRQAIELDGEHIFELK